MVDHECGLRAVPFHTNVRLREGIKMSAINEIYALASPNRTHVFTIFDSAELSRTSQFAHLDQI